LAAASFAGDDAGVSDVDEARRLAERLVGGLGRRWVHVQGVAAAAEELAAGLPTGDRARLVTSAWLHDIGYAPELVRSGLHPIDGAAHLAALDRFDPVVVSLVAHHTGAAFEAEERGLADSMLAYPRPPTHLLDRLTTSDLLTGPDGRRMLPRDRIEEILRRYPPGDPVHQAVTRSAPTLIEAADTILEQSADVRSDPAVIERVGDPKTH
jgi:hypothetical protein